MGFFDQVSRTVSHGIDRAKFEADKFQRITRIQSELNDVKRLLDSKLIDLGQRAYELHRAGQITSASVSELARAIDNLRSSLVVKEDELKAVQAETFPEPPPPPPPASTSYTIPIEDAAPTTPISPGPAPAAPLPAQPAAPHTCLSCGFQMPAQAVFCPNCGRKSTA